MYQKIHDLLHRNSAILLYLFFGALTTAVNYVVYFPLYNTAELSAVLSNSVAWVAAVIFAFLTNKPFVFKSHDWTAKTVFPELMKFFSCRIASGFVESIVIFITVDLLNFNGNLWKILVSILVVIVNYIGSKLIVFRH